MLRRTVPVGNLNFVIPLFSKRQFENNSLFSIQWYMFHTKPVASLHLSKLEETLFTPNRQALGILHLPHFSVKFLLNGALPIWGWTSFSLQPATKQWHFNSENKAGAGITQKHTWIPQSPSLTPIGYRMQRLKKEISTYQSRIFMHVFASCINNIQKKFLIILRAVFLKKKNMEKKKENIKCEAIVSLQISTLGRPVSPPTEFQI